MEQKMKKVFKVKFTYMESGYCIIEAESKSKAEKKLYNRLMRKGIDGLDTYNLIDSETDVFDAEEI
jgi:hypothetical protein